MSKYSYQVKVFDSNSKRKFIIRQLHHFTDRFTSIDHIMDVISSEIENLTTTILAILKEERTQSNGWCQMKTYRPCMKNFDFVEVAVYFCGVRTRRVRRSNHHHQKKEKGRQGIS